jgi:polyisoprenoid-binding protein YceI
MRDVVLNISLFLILSSSAYSQRYTAKEGMVDFYSQATLEDIRAENKKIHSLFNASTKEIAFRIRISDFKFRKKLMQEHFNEKYMESEKYPDATFTGVLEGFTVDKQGTQNVTAKGSMKIHGVTREVEIPGTIELVPDGANMKSVFKIRLEHYNIAIPQILWQNIAEEVEVTLHVKYKKN